MGLPALHYPSLSVEFGAVLVLAAAFLARVLLRRFGIPSIITLLGRGLAAGPSGIGWLRLDLTAPDLEAEFVEDEGRVIALVRERRARALIVTAAHP